MSQPVRRHPMHPLPISTEFMPTPWLLNHLVANPPRFNAAGRLVGGCHWKYLGLTLAEVRAARERFLAVKPN